MRLKPLGHLSAKAGVALADNGNMFKRLSSPAELAAAAVGLAMGMSLLEISEALEKLELRSKWRMESYDAGRGITLVNDAYNANPDSVRAAIDVLMTNPNHTVLVLGDMGEVGEQGVHAIKLGPVNQLSSLRLNADQARVVQCL